MPELPEVEALALDLGGRLDGRAIVTVHVPQFSALKTFDPPISALEGTLVDRVGRFGKFLDIEASGTHLVLHLARAGWVRWRDEVPAIPPKPSPKSTLALRIVLDDDGSGTSPGLDVTEAGTRKSLAAYVVRDPMDVPGIASLGPDPLTDDFTEEALGEILQREGRKQLKGVLRHQGTIAGIGNAYSDEILHAARMSPYALASTLDPETVAHLYDAMQTTLAEAIAAASGKPPADLKDAKRRGMKVHARRGESCPVCGDDVRSVYFADNSLEYCATCQTGGKVLADRRMSRLLK